MIKRVLVVSMVGLSLVGCVNNDTLSGDVYTASEAKQVQNVSYGTIVIPSWWYRNKATLVSLRANVSYWPAMAVR